MLNKIATTPILLSRTDNYLELCFTEAKYFPCSYYGLSTTFQIKIKSGIKPWEMYKLLQFCHCVIQRIMYWFEEFAWSEVQHFYTSAFVVRHVINYTFTRFWSSYKNCDLESAKWSQFVSSKSETVNVWLVKRTSGIKHRKELAIIGWEYNLIRKTAVYWIDIF